MILGKEKLNFLGQDFLVFITRQELASLPSGPVTLKYPVFPDSVSCFRHSLGMSAPKCPSPCQIAPWGAAPVAHVGDGSKYSHGNSEGQTGKGSM